jgi:ferredoxin--NADP+ reductase
MSTITAPAAAAAPAVTPHAPVLREAHTHIYRMVGTPTSPGPVKVKIHRNELATFKKSASVVRHVEIDVSGTNLAGKCQSGQALGVLPDERSFNNGIDPKTGKPHKLRLYSMSHPTRGEDGKGNIIAVTVKRTIDEHWTDHKLFIGVASNWLCDRQPGETINVCGPNGKDFLLPKDVNKHDYVFIATGTGIAPFRGMITDLLEAGCKSRIVLIMGVPYHTDLLYHDFFLRKAHENPNFAYMTQISREEGNNSKGRYVQDRIRTERDFMLPILSSERTLIYMCGLAGMELGIFQELALQLNGSALEQYLQVDKETLRDIRGWSSKDMGTKVKSTHRVLKEVYK